MHPWLGPFLFTLYSLTIFYPHLPHAMRARTGLSCLGTPCEDEDHLRLSILIFINYYKFLILWTMKLNELYTKKTFYFSISKPCMKWGNERCILVLMRSIRFLHLHMQTIKWFWAQMVYKKIHHHSQSKKPQISLFLDHEMSQWKVHTSFDELL